jgi:hypothetical protein
VLTEALARDHRARTKCGLTVSQRHVSTFIQNVHRFIGEYFSDPRKVPVDRVVVFDEAQRAWNAMQSLRKFKRNFSEPEIMLDIMNRHPDWAVIVALVGVGQEINTGEAGMGEWGRALSRRFQHWSVALSPELLVQTSAGNGLFASTPSRVTVHESPDLHLNVNLRSYKAEKFCQFVDALLDRDCGKASQIISLIDQYPIVLTRSLEAARQWLKHRQRGTRRIGLVATSGGRRLLAHGLDVKIDLNVENWFLNASGDVRSSFYLELPATEFAIQGLELDWTGLCWDADLVPSGRGWLYRKFRGTKWQRVKDITTQQFILNKYRVLLTRAREGMVLWVPPGSLEDPTRPPALYDRIAEFLKNCGVQELRE